MSFYKNVAFGVSDTPTDAEEFLLRTFDWSASKSTWKAATVKEMLEHFGVDSSQSACTVYGRVIRKLNGNMAKRSNGKTYTWLPPMKG